MGNSLNVFAKEGEWFVENYEATAIRDAELLMKRAELGIDDFKQDTGLDFKVSCETTNLGLVSKMNSDIDNLVTTYQTSQYLGEIVNEQGEVNSIYALQGVTVYRDTTVSDTETNAE